MNFELKIRTTSNKRIPKGALIQENKVMFFSKRKLAGVGGLIYRLDVWPAFSVGARCWLEDTN